MKTIPLPLLFSIHLPKSRSVMTPRGENLLYIYVLSPGSTCICSLEAQNTIPTSVSSWLFLEQVFPHPPPQRLSSRQLGLSSLALTHAQFIGIKKILPSIKQNCVSCFSIQQHLVSAWHVRTLITVSVSPLLMNGMGWGSKSKIYHLLTNLEGFNTTSLSKTWILSSEWLHVRGFRLSPLLDKLEVILAGVTMAQQYWCFLVTWHNC